MQSLDRTIFGAASMIAGGFVAIAGALLGHTAATAITEHFPWGKVLDCSQACLILACVLLCWPLGVRLLGYVFRPTSLPVERR